MKDKALKIGGIVAILGGSAALYIAGTDEATITALVAGFFVLAGVVAGIFGFNKKKQLYTGICGMLEKNALTKCSAII